MSKRSQAKIDISLVIPLFNEEQVFPLLHERLSEALELLSGTIEVVLVNDGSFDDTRRLIGEAVSSDSRYVGIHLSRNFGHQAAVSAGLAAARGDVIAVLDGDLQDPPEILPEFIEKLGEGYDVVYAVRQKRQEGFLKRLSYAGFYRLLRFLSPIDIPLDSGDFCVMTRRIAREIVAMPETHRFVRGMRAYCGFRQVGLDYHRGGRAEGTSKYSITHLLRLAADGIVSFSIRPLRLATLLGFLSAILAMLYSIYLIVWRFQSDDNTVPGFATVVVAILYMGSVQLVCIGVLGEYVGRIHNEVKARPPFVIDEIESSKDSESDA